MKVLVFTTDVIPLPGLATSGTALRTWGMIQGLKAHGHEVQVSVPRSALEGLKRSPAYAEATEPVKQSVKDLELLQFDPKNQQSIISQLAPDMVLCGHWPAMTLSRKPSQLLVIDLAGPHMLERHFQGSSNQIGAILGKLNALQLADFYIVSGKKQRLYFLSFLLRAGVQNPETRILEITMPLSPELPSKRERQSEYPHFVFGGVFLPWQNPSKALRQVKEKLDQKNKGFFTLIGGKHPNYDIKGGVYEALFAELSKSSRVRTAPMLPYEDFIHALQGVDVAVDVMAWNLERELAMTIRSTTYLWSGVPTIYNNYADLAQVIRQYDAGWTVSPDKPEELDGVLEQIYAEPNLVQQKSENARRLASEVFAWDKAVSPLLSLMKSPEASLLREIDIILDFPENASYNLTKGKDLEQLFVCRVDGLSRIECRLATHNRNIQKPLWVTLYGLENLPEASALSQLPKTTRQLLYRKQFSPQEIKNNDWLTIDVEPLDDSAGKSFVLRLESDEDTLDQAITPWATKGSPYPLMGLYYGGEKVRHSALCLRTTCRGRM